MLLCFTPKEEKSSPRYPQMTDQGEEHLNTSVVSLQHGEEHLAPGLIAAVTISSMFIFYFVLMMVVCLGEWYQYTHGKKGKSVVIRSNSSTTTSNMRSQIRRSRHFSYTDEISGQSEHRVPSTAGQLEDSSTDKPSSSSSNEIKETVCVHEVEGMVCMPRTEEEVPMIKTEVEVNVHESGVKLNRREEKVHIHIDSGICNDECNSGIPEYLDGMDDISFGINDSDLPLLPKFRHSDETLETDDDFLTESSESCYLHKAEANV